MYGNSEHVLTCLDRAQKRLSWAVTILNLHMTRAKESGACRRWRFTSTCDMIPHEMIWHDMTRYDIRWHDATWCHMAWCDVLRCDVTRRDMTWHGMTRHEMMWHDMRWYNSILELMWYDDKAERPLVLWSQRLECVLWCLRLLVPQSRQIMRKRLVSFEKQRFALVREAQLGVAVETCQNYFVKLLGYLHTGIGRIRVMDIWWFWNQAEKRLQKNEIKEHRNRIQIWTSKIWETPQLLFFFPPAENFKRWSLG